MAVRERPDEKRLLIQLFPHVLDAFGDQVGGGFASGFLGEHGGGGGDRGFGGGTPHVGGGLRLGLGDLGFRHLGAASNKFFHARLRFSGEPLGLGPGTRDDALRLALGLAERLAGDTLQLVAIDLRGRGRSEVTGPGSYGWRNHARDVLGVADAVGMAAACGA